MSYCSQADIEGAIGAALLIDLCDDAGTGSMDAAALVNFGEAVGSADNTINGFIRAKYSVPVAGSVPPMLNKLSIDLTLYYLYRRRAAHHGLPDHIVDAEKTARRQLEMINMGKLDLGIEPPPAASGKVVADTDGPDRLFTSDTMEDF